MRRVLLKVLLPENRNQKGGVTVEVDGLPAASFEVLGRGSRGPGDTQFLRNGNTPTGVYRGGAWKSTHGQSRASYGANGKLTLEPVSGNALTANRYFNRVDLLIHGGDLDTRPGSPWEGDLKPTHGCLRLRNEDVAALHRILLSAASDEARMMSVAPQVWINVQEGSRFDETDDGLNRCLASPYVIFGDAAGLQFQRP